jgi:hypothetical protein
MRYLLLLYGDEQAEDSLTPDERRAIVEQHIAFAGRLREAGAHVAGEALGNAAEAKVVRREEERTVVTDGPFAETKEQLGGFYLLECADVDEAVRWAEQVPKSPGLIAELRPVVPS